jgi:hypothetical protein
MDYTQEFHGRLNNILKTGFNSRNITSAIIFYPNFIHTNAFEIISWSQMEIENYLEIYTKNTEKVLEASFHSSLERDILQT